MMIGTKQTAPCREDRLRYAVDEILEASIAALEPEPLRAAVAHAVGGGKRVRPLLTLLVCEAVGGDYRTAVPAAAALEFLHTSSLVHDDIMDGSERRRGRPTVHHVYGTPTAILAGDALIALAFRLLQRVEGPNSGAIREEFASAFLHICEGQGMDLHFGGTAAVSKEAHRRMVEKKTARLMAAASAIGALAGTTDARVIRTAAHFGADLGMAFQAHDDLLDEAGDADVMGKPAGVDARNGKQTYLSLAYASSAAPSPVTGVGTARRVVEEYTASACASLEGLPASPARAMLTSLTLALAERRC